MKRPREIEFTRSHAVLRMRKRLESESFPRIQMALIVAITGGSGLVASAALLRAGIESMALRYPLALAIAYLTFLFLLWLWLRTRGEDYIDFPTSSDSPGEAAGHASFRGDGGEFAGGGASDSFDAAPDVGALDSPSSAVSDAAGSIGDAASPIGDAASSVVDADELAIPLVALGLVAALAVASLYVVYLAPVLFAEIMVDAALSFALYRHLRGKDSSHWLATAFRRTILPFAGTAVFLVLLGAAMSAYAPGARTVGEVVRHASEAK